LTLRSPSQARGRGPTPRRTHWGAPCSPPSGSSEPPLKLPPRARGHLIPASVVLPCSPRLTVMPSSPHRRGFACRRTGARGGCRPAPAPVLSPAVMRGRVAEEGGGRRRGRGSGRRREMWLGRWGWVRIKNVSVGHRGEI
jgi:hypothetical protein